MRKQILATAAAMICAGAFTAAQDPSTPGQPSSPAEPRAGAQVETRAGDQETTTLTGCVYREESVPGRAPNIAERVGILEDYILAVSMSPGASREGAAVGTAGQAGPDASREAQDRADASPDADVRGTSGSAGGHSMFKLEHVDDDVLQALVGKRVEVTGKIDAEADDLTADGRPQADRGLGPDDIELPEFEVASIREIAGECPATPAVNQ